MNGKNCARRLTEPEHLICKIAVALDENPSVERIGRMIQKMKTNLRNFAADQAGTTAIEYALIVTAVFFALIPVVNVIMNTQVNVIYQTINDYFAAV